MTHGGPAGEAPPERPPDGDREVERLFSLVRDRYGDRLTPSELEELRKGVEGVVLAARALRAVRLPSSTEPAQPFVPYRALP
jgi:hypothetical protein